MTTELLLRVYPDHLFAYHGRSLLISDRSGVIAGGLQGLYEHDLRLLSHYRLLVHGRPPRLDALSSVEAHSTLGYYVGPPTPDGDDELHALGLSKAGRDHQHEWWMVASTSRSMAATRSERSLPRPTWCAGPGPWVRRSL